MSFVPPRRIEKEYAVLINKLINKFIPPGTPQSVLTAFANLSRNPEVLSALANSIAARMVTQLKVNNTRNWREVAREASRGREIYEGLQREMEGAVGARVNAIVGENARLIQSVPEKVASELANEIQKLQLQGLRPAVIQEYVQKRVPQLTRSKARLLARTETSKAATALTEARSEELGIPAYVWETSQDQRVRKSHRLMQGVIVFWSDPPSPEALAHENSYGNYQAGSTFNCRCIALPIVSLDLISWPARVYRAGGIERMTRRKFSEISGIGRRVAA